MNKSTIAVIVEGADYEKRLLHNIKTNFFNKRWGNSSIEVLSLPVEMNIYMLWNRMSRSEYEEDIIEVIREISEEFRKRLSQYKRNDFAEVYLFFDYDKHQNNLPKGINPNIVILNMLDYFDNETEHGKLYISYPMAEAIRDFVPGSCFAATGKCFNNIVGDYKSKTKGNNEVVDINKFTISSWEKIIGCYIARLSCLFDNNQMDLQLCKSMTVRDIFLYQTKYGKHVPEYIVLSAFPGFILDYFSFETIHSMLNITETNMCEEKYN